MTRVVLIGFAAALAGNAAGPALRVDASGDAEVSWTEGGRRMTMLVPGTGRIAAGRLAGPDVSRALPGVHVPFQRAIRTGPDGWYYALQTWQAVPGGPVELRFSRWQGVPPDVSLTATEAAAGGVRLSGHATVDDTPFRPVPRSRAYVDALRDGSWTRLGSVPLSSAGAFAWTVPAGQTAPSYRVTVTGQNRGATLAPDASAVADAPVQLDPGR